MRKAILELTSQCPVARDNPEDCPLRSIRKLTAKKRRLWVEWLDDDEVVYLTLYHHACMKNKLAGSPPSKPGETH